MNFIGYLTIAVSICAIVISIVQLRYSIIRKKKISQFISSIQEEKIKLINVLNAKNNNDNDNFDEFIKVTHEIEVLMRNDKDMKKYIDDDFIKNSFRNEKYLNELVLN